MIANLLGALSVRRVPCLRSTPGPGPRRLLLLLLPPQLHRSGGYSSSSSYSSSRSSYSSSYSSSSNADESCNSVGKGSYSSSSKSYSSRGNATDNSGRYSSYSSSSNNNNSSNSDSSSSGSLYDNGSCDISNSSRSRSSSSSRFGGGGGGGGGTDINNSSSSNSCSSGSGSDGRIRISSSRISSSRRSGVRKQSGGGGVSLARKGGGGGAAESPSAPKQESLCRRQPSSSMAANQSKIDWNSWEKAKDQLTKLKDMDERRKYYKCSSNYITLKSLDKWSEKDLHSQDLHSQDKLTELEKPGGREYEVNHQINDKVSLFKGDITLLEIDAIVNAANSTLLGGGGVDGCIHRSAGSLLKEECRSLGGCSTGKAKITCGYRLPSKYVIHTVGPRVMDSVPTPEERKQLDGCYSECLHIVEDKELRSVAFPCISTGIYGFPNEPAARIALETTRNWLEKYHSKVDRIIFCLFLPIDVELYDTLMPVYFPRAPKESSEGVADGPAVAGTENESDDKAPPASFLGHRVKSRDALLAGLRRELRREAVTPNASLPLPLLLLLLGA